MPRAHCSQAGRELQFPVGAKASVDTRAFSSLSGPTRASWSLYYKIGAGGAWSLLGTQQGASLSSLGAAGPLTVEWALDAIGVVAGEEEVCPEDPMCRPARVCTLSSAAFEAA